jgi:predicted NBD/HSP70 family sugar kinase
MMASLRDGPAVPGSLRQMNRLTILRLLREMGPTTKPALARQSGISRPTTSKVVDDLEASGLAERIGMTQPASNGGKPGAIYRFNAGGVRSGAVFLRVDAVQVAIIDGNAHVHARVDHPLGNDRHPEPVIALIVTTLRELLARLGLAAEDLLGVGIGVPGLTSFHKGIVHFAPHLPDWRDVPLSESVASALGTQVWVDNDCHVQALAERHFGIGKAGRSGANGTEFVSVQSGIGLSAAFYLNGALYRGPGDTAGEIGHMTVQDQGRLCECGNRGCWETVASITRLVDEACQTTEGTLHLPAWLDVPEFAGQTFHTIQDVDPSAVTACAHAIFCAARAGHAEADALVRTHACHFGVGLANLVNMLNPQRIIVWGDSVDAGEVFLETVRKVVRERALMRARENCEIVFTRLDHDVGLIGAGSLALDALFDGLALETPATRHIL